MIAALLKERGSCEDTMKELDSKLKSKLYHQTSNIRHTKSQHVKVFRLILQLSLPNPLKSGVKPRMKM